MLAGKWRRVQIYRFITDLTGSLNMKRNITSINSTGVLQIKMKLVCFGFRNHVIKTLVSY